GLLLTRTIDISGYPPPPSEPTYSPLPVPPTILRYSPAGEPIHIEQAGTVVSSDYDSLGRTVRESSAAGPVEFTWDAEGNRTGLLYPVRRAIRYHYSPAGYLTRIYQTSSGITYPR